MATRDPFDFFFGEVLQLAPGQSDPDHYTLLGLAFFEPDREKIRRAGHDRKRSLRAVPAGSPELEHVRRQLIERVREARRTLLDPARRETYDAFLTGHGAAPEEPDFSLEPGAEFAARFRILKELRRGAFGRVYAALDGREGRRIELTVLPPGASHDPARHRSAERAARQLMRVDDARVLSVAGVGESEGLLHARWTAPEGVTLLHHVRRKPHGRLESDEASRIGDGIARALAALHEQGIHHGHLHPRNIYVTDAGQVSLVECGLAAAACVPGDVPTSPYSAPERAVSRKADHYSLGAVTYFMLQGEAPFLDGGRALVPKPLPDEVPVALARTVLGLLAREQSQRPDELQFASSTSARRRRTPLALVALLSAAVVFALWMSGLFTPAESGAGTPVGDAWKLIGERRFAKAILLLDAEPMQESIEAPLASALEGEAHRLEQDGDPYAAQRLLARAEQVSPNAGRATQLERVRASMLKRLAAVGVTVPAVARELVIRIDAGEVGLASVFVDGRAVRAGESITVARDEGTHRVPYQIEDRAGNRREGFVTAAVDRTPPEVKFVGPIDGTMQRAGAVSVEIEVSDAHPPAAVTIHGREAPVTGGTARLPLTLPNGVHTIVVRVVDLAGNARESSVTITIDDRAPEIMLDGKRVVSRSSNAVVRGRVAGFGSTLTVDGQPVRLGENGSFAVKIDLPSSRTIALEATGPTGVVRKTNVKCIRDTAEPKLSVLWARKDAAGRMLYGGKEMDAKGVRVRLRVSDDTKLKFEPSEGTVEGDVWTLAAHEGEREATLRAVDEAGNSAVAVVRLAGHRATPGLSVKTQLGPVTRDSRTVLEIEADHDVFLNDKLVEPGRIDVPLREGKVELHVRAVDPYGNDTHWRRTVLVDRTPPRVRVVGPKTRGVGRQLLTLEADEEMASVTCLSTVMDDPGKRATFDVVLEAGRTHLHVVARDRAGNVSKLKLELRVINRALLLDGKSAVRVPLDPKMKEFTVEFWARGTPAIDPAIMVSRGVERAWQVVWASGDEALPHALVHFAVEGPATLVAKKLRDPTDWHHYALVHDGKKLRFFIDGKQQGYMEAKVGLVAGTASLLIGGAGLDDGGRVRDGFVGRLDELHVSDGARYIRAFKPKRYFAADAKTRLLMRFDLIIDGKHPDESASALKGTPIGEPKLAVAQD